MKIAIYSRFPGIGRLPSGGVETVTVGLAKALEKATNHELHVLTFNIQEESYARETLGRITVHHLKKSAFPQIVDIINGPGRSRLLKLIDEIKPDIVHSHETHGLMLSNIKYPHVFTVHGFDHANVIAERRRFRRLRSVLWRLVERYGLGRQRHLISISPYVNTMIERYARQAEIYNIDNPVDEAYFLIDRERKTNDVLCVGWINERKNTIGAVKAVAHAIRQGYPLRLKIAGKPQNEAYLSKVKQIIRENEVQDSIIFLGHIGKEQLQTELATAMCMLLPSLQENAPMAISEAMAAGIPVLASNRCGMPYMIADKLSGFLVDPENCEDIGEKLIRLVSDENMCLKMGNKGREIAVARFHPDIIAKKTIEVYEKVLRG